jgi:hypothetical protein
MVRWNLASLLIIPLSDFLVMPVCLRQARFHRVVFFFLQIIKKPNGIGTINGKINEENIGSSVRCRSAEIH